MGASKLSGRCVKALLGEIEALLVLWPSEAPIPPGNPTSVAQVTAKTKAVKRELP